MAPNSRKRSNAFNDFPASDAGSETQTAARQAAKTLNGAAGNISATQKEELPVVERIERLKPSQMLPDRFQPRHLLPYNLRVPFYSGQIDCYRAAAEWLSQARSDGGLRAEIDRLLAMGGSFEEHGQIKAITGAWLTLTDGRFIFQIETGERRFWAACLHFISGEMNEEPLLRVEVVSHPTRQRQVLENRHAEAPSAVGQACEIASLILAELNLQPEVGLADEYDYFRQARAQRMPAGLWERIMPIMQLTRPRMVQLLNILQFPTPLLDQADRFRLPERVLREVLALPHDQWERMLRISIQNSLTAEDVSEMLYVDGGSHSFSSKKSRHTSPAVPQPQRIAVSGLRRFANALMELDEVSRQQALDEVADELVGTRQAEGLMHLLDELAHLVQTRLTRL
jgi:hypothetical protein